MNVPKFAKNIYIEPNAPSVHALKKMVQRQSLGKRVQFTATYFVCIRENGKFSMEIFRFNELFKTVNAHGQYMIVGAASNRTEAFNLVRKMVADFVTEDFSEYNDFSRLRNYVLKRTEVGYE